MYGRVGVWQGCPKMLLLGSVKIKPKLQWRPQDVSHARIIRCPSTEAPGMQKSQREKLYVVGYREGGDFPSLL